MKKVTLFFALLLVTITLQAQVQPTDTDGDGYYNISTLDHLRWVSENESCWSWNFELDNDIDAGDTKNWNFGDHDNDTSTSDSAMGWRPIGYYSKSFTGDFEGNGYAIDSLYINRPDQQYTGFFGYAKDSQINNIGISNCNVTGYRFIGGLVGYNLGNIVLSYATGAVAGNGDNIGGLVGMVDKFATITDCYATGTITGNGDNIGGLAGMVYTFATITSCYATGTVTSDGENVGGLIGEVNELATITNCYAMGAIVGAAYVGGLLGMINELATITNCYATGTVDGENHIGGLIGYNNNSDITNCFWDIETSGIDSSAGGTGKTSIEMKTKSTFSNANWNFTHFWAIDKSLNDAYPYINYRPLPVTVGIEPTDTDDDGSLNISTFAHLVWVSEHDNSWDWDFELDNDIDASSSIYWETLLGFSPIGNHSKPFTGDFNGNGYAIDSLHINRPNQYYVGLFGYTSENNIKNLGISNCSIRGWISAGGLVGQNTGIITNCYATGNIKGFMGVGGLVGATSGEIKNCYATVNATGSGNMGGLVGHNTGIIMNSYATGNLNGAEYIGGFIGSNQDGVISNCYATGDVNGRFGVAGFIGSNLNSLTITNCYATGKVTVTGNIVGGFIGELSVYVMMPTKDYPITITNCFWDIETSGQTTSQGGTPKTTAEMKTKSTFIDANWDFETIWAIDPNINDGYPYFGTNTGVVTENILPTTNLTCSPNPCSTSSKIDYSVNNAGFVNIAVYDIFGNEVAVLVNNFQTAGEHEITFNAEELSAGVYFIKINTAENMEAKKIIVAR